MAGQYINTDTMTNAASTPVVTLANGDTLLVTQEATVAARGATSFAITTGTGANVASMTINGDVYAADAEAIHGGASGQRIIVGETGSVASNTDEAIFLGVDVSGSGNAYISNAGDLHGYGAGVIVNPATSVTLINSGGITSETSDGVSVAGTTAKITNSGEILGATNGLAVHGAANITNAVGGTISGGANIGLIFSGGGAATIVNRGSISGGVEGVDLLETGLSLNFTNSGDITSGGVGLHVSHSAGQSSLQISNSGTITAGVGSNAIETGQGNTTILNSGLIAGGIKFNGGIGNFYDGAHGVVSGEVHGFINGDFLVGGEATDMLFGEGGNDFMEGNGGADTLDGGAGVDTVEGGGGSDRYYVDDTDDVVNEDVGDGVDRIYATADYTLGAGQEIEFLIGQFVPAPASPGAAFSLTGLRLTGNEFNNQVVGYDNNDQLAGQEGADTLNGGIGDDLMRGGEGDDRYWVDSASDVIREIAGEGNDRVVASVSYTLGAGQEIETLTTTNTTATAAINLTGNEFANTLIANAGANTLDGKGGLDTMKGLDGNDTYFVDSASDVARETVGDGFDKVVASVSYTLTAGQEIERLQAVSVNATTALNFTGNEFGQDVWGNAGVNALNGGLGADSLDGKGGHDQFRFTTALGSGNIDTIIGFTVSTGTAAETDKVQLDDAVFKALTPGALPAAAFGSSASGVATNASQRILYNTTSGALFYDDDGNGAHAAVQFATLSGHPAGVTAADFTVI